MVCPSYVIFCFLIYFFQSPTHADQLPSDENDSLRDWPQINQIWEIGILMLLLSTLLFMPRYPRPHGAAVDSVLFSTFSPRISEHFTKTGSSPQSVFVKEATTLSPQMSPRSWELGLRGCQYFLRVTGIPSAGLGHSLMENPSLHRNVAEGASASPALTL